MCKATDHACPQVSPSGDEFMILQTIGVYEIIQHHFKLIG
jgi:hypothetical protein